MNDNYQSYVQAVCDNLERELRQDFASEEIHDDVDYTFDLWATEDPARLIQRINYDYIYDLVLPEEHYDNVKNQRLNHSSAMMVIRNSNHIYLAINRMLIGDDYCTVAANAFRADVIQCLLNKLNIEYPIEKICVFNTL